MPLYPENMHSMKHIFLILSLLAHVNAATYYIAPTGSDNAAGSKTAPFASWAKGQTAAIAGDTVFFRAGTYYYTKAITNCASQTDNVNANVLDKSGSSGKLIHYMAYPGETPIFDFYSDTCNCRIRGVFVSGSWIHLKGLELRGVPQINNLNHENWCIYITGSNNIFELLNTHHNMGPGIIIWGGVGNLVLNCDSHDNWDKLTSNGSGQSADGFGCHTNVTGTVANIFRGCRSWSNSDDGFDCISNHSPVIVDNCWNWLSGYQPGTTISLPDGNGNGFKIGGYGNPPSGQTAPIPQNTVRNCVSFLNKVAGFYQNHHPAQNYYYNNTAYKNGVNFDMLGYDLATSTGTGMGIYRNNIAYGSTNATSNSGPENLVDASYNSWNLTSTANLTNADFLSIDTAGIYGSRKADGSLPDVKFLHLSAGSKCIDKGINVGIAYNGTAPDLGAFEYSATAITIIKPEYRNGTGNSFTIDNKNSPKLFDVSGRIINLLSYHNTSTPLIFVMPQSSGTQSNSKGILLEHIR